jgi:hypothetical protein
MPSEDSENLILEALGRPIEDFRSALATAVEQVRAFLDAQPVMEGGPAPEDDAAFGSFARSRLDTNRFTALLSRSRVLDDVSIDRVRKAFAVLSALAGRKSALHHVRVEPGASLAVSVDAALAEVGRAFGAARIVELSRSGRYVEAEHARFLAELPHVLWNRAERDLAPPQVVHVDGADLNAEALAEFLDGVLKIVLVVRGDAPPAPLVRLITPGVFVMQTLEEADVARLAAWEGPGIAAIVPEGAARFVHDPAAGRHLWERMSVQHVPEVQARRRIGGLSTFQQREQVRQLTALSDRPAGGAPAAGAPAGAATGAGDDVDKLAAWLLAQADLQD